MHCTPLSGICRGQVFAHAFTYMHAPCSHLYASLHALAHMFESEHAHCSRYIQPVFHVPVSCCTFSPVRSHHYTLYCAHFHFLPLKFYTVLCVALCFLPFVPATIEDMKPMQDCISLYFLFFAEPSCVQHFLCSCCAACFCCLSLVPFLKEKAILIPRWDPLFICQWL